MISNSFKLNSIQSNFASNNLANIQKNNSSNSVKAFFSDSFSFSNNEKPIIKPPLPDDNVPYPDNTPFFQKPEVKLVGMSLATAAIGSGIGYGVGNALGRTALGASIGGGIGLLIPTIGLLYALKSFN